uniref:Putative secreted protein n=1 Tax=Anopheles darlingi TaxID=43151 RepID=A0A2M4DN53_ANODA
MLAVVVVLSVASEPTELLVFLALLSTGMGSLKCCFSSSDFSSISAGATCCKGDATAGGSLWIAAEVGVSGSTAGFSVNSSTVSVFCSAAGLPVGFDGLRMLRLAATLTRGRLVAISHYFYLYTPAS